MIRRFVTALLVITATNTSASLYPYTFKLGNVEYSYLLDDQNHTVTFDPVVFYDVGSFIPISIYNAIDRSRVNGSSQFVDIETDVRINSISISHAHLIGTQKFTATYTVPAIVGMAGNIGFDPANPGAPPYITIHGVWTATGPTESFSDVFSATVQLNSVTWFRSISYRDALISAKFSGIPALTYSQHSYLHAPDTGVVDGVPVSFPAGDILIEISGDGGCAAVLLPLPASI